MRILIADDNTINQKVLSNHLMLFGECDVANDGRTAWDMLRKSFHDDDPYSLLCLDIAMPEMNGYEVLSALRNFETEKEIPEDKKVNVLLITAFYDEKTLFKAQNDCQGYLLKPITKEKLVEKLSLMGFSEKSHLAEQEEEPAAAYADMVPTAKEVNGQIELFLKHKPAEDEPEELMQSNSKNIELFQNVIIGQMLLRLDPPDIPLKAGEGVFQNKQTGVMYATKNGYASLDGDTLNITENLVINEDVKFKNIDFLGKVEINGDVYDDAHINAAKGIKISGSVGACHLKSDGDIEFERINGKNKALIICGGNFKAKFIYNATIECQGNIEIQTEAVDSILKSRGDISCGTVTGGECHALNTIELNRAGSPKDVSTLLKTGYDFFRTDMIDALEKNTREIEGRLKEIDRMLGPGQEAVATEEMSEKRKEKTEAMIREKKNLQTSLDEYKEQIKKLSRPRTPKSAPQIVINDVLYKGVRLIVDDMQELSFEEIKGPMTLDENFIQL
jgi:CheY-like chemotaxis protein